ncbi:hypothetical protein [Fibrella forsythiae]|uniref:Uncharacterized protein n=1 Tax=Fibrella forsythiae TaxID=2817061 RepID=A0ABS3JU50_9BACT|nr:hypothetical protein [Fibrella forsythiae]MBO0952993.1 hypothetical protein [Fibrella forsythiae]
MTRTNVPRLGQSASPAPASGLSGPSGPSLRLKQIQDYQILARVRLKERLSGSPTSATLYDLLMRDQLTSIKRQRHA